MKEPLARKPHDFVPRHSFFFYSCPSFLDEPREETLATQAKSIIKYSKAVIWVVTQRFVAMGIAIDLPEGR